MDSRIRGMYRTLLYMGKEYPAQSGGYQTFQKKLKLAFVNTPISNEQELKLALEKGEYIVKELEALYFLTRYRDMKRKYYD